MKPKIIILLALFFCGSIAASPDRCGRHRTTCCDKQKIPVNSSPVTPAIIMLDESELLPFHHYLSNI